MRAEPERGTRIPRHRMSEAEARLHGPRARDFKKRWTLHTSAHQSDTEERRTSVKDLQHGRACACLCLCSASLLLPVWSCEAGWPGPQLSCNAECVVDVDVECGCGMWMWSSAERVVEFREPVVDFGEQTCGLRRASGGTTGRSCGYSRSE